MESLRSKVFATLVAVLLVIVACEKTTEPTEEQPTFPTFQITTPSATATSDTCNLKAYIYAISVQALAQFSASFAALPGQNVNGVWTWSVTEDGVTQTLTAQKQADGSYSWKFVFNGTDENDQTVYNNWIAMEGTTSADGSTGSLTIYDDSEVPAQVIYLQVSWRPVTNGIEITFDQYSSGQPVLRVVLVGYGNGSGEVTEYVRSGSNWVPTGFHATWSGQDAVAVCS
ncbi:MAG: hypothetical protein HYW57_02465 [Ignavibacteriales bacterium]|nr:hypothetical protein [Ignavibacteriales bacterium]